MMDSEQQTVHSLREVERILSVSRATLYRWCEKGIVSYTRLPSGHLRILDSEIARLMQAKRGDKQ